MKAIVYHEYGFPDVLRLHEVAKPIPAEDEVLVKIEAASVNPAEWHAMRGKPFLARMDRGVFKPKYPILGADIAGRVLQVGQRVTMYKPGDEVFGRSQFGGFAEYVCIPKNRLALKPTNLSFESAAAVPLGALTGLQGLRKGHIQPGQKVLINGASGGIGTFTVQIAKSFGTNVTGVCSTRNLDMVRSIGADHVIDYTQDNFKQSGQRYDLIIDTVGNLTVADCKRLLNPNGNCVVLGFEDMGRLFQVMVLGTWTSKTGNQKISLINATTNTEDLTFIKHLIEAGKIVPIIDRCYPFSEIPEALRYLGTRRARGKVVISLNKTY